MGTAGTDVTTAALLGAAIGLDWTNAGGGFALGPELRAFSFVFGNDSDGSISRGHSTRAVVALGVNLTFLIGRH